MIKSKSAFISLVIYFVCVLTFFIIQKDTKEFSVDRIAVIDTICNNYIFRGASMFTNQDDDIIFAYDKLSSYFAKNNISLHNYYLIDISLLDFDNYAVIHKESQFFEKHSDYGKFINISTLSPSLLFAKFPNNFVTKRYNLWLDKILNAIHDIKKQKLDKPFVIYIHCDAGRDRTGLIISAYRLLFKNMNLKEVNMQNIKETGRDAVFPFNNAIHSYCLHIQKNHNKPDDYCNN